MIDNTSSVINDTREFNVIKLKDYAKQHSVTYRTAWNRFNAGKIKDSYKDELGNVLIKIYKNNKHNLNNVAIYSRVSNHSAKENLVRQNERLTDYSIRKGFNIIKSVSEIASGMNDNRPLLNKLLLDKDDSWGTLVIENKDRLTRFGFNYLKLFLEKEGKQLIVVNQVNDNNTDIVQDLISIIYSFSAKLYGKRNNKNRVEKIVTEINNLNSTSLGENVEGEIE